MACQQEGLKLIAELCLQCRRQLLAGFLLGDKDEIEKVPELLFPARRFRECVSEAANELIREKRSRSSGSSDIAA